MELNNDEDNTNISDYAQTDNTTGAETNKRKKRRVLVDSAILISLIH